MSKVYNKYHNTAPQGEETKMDDLVETARRAKGSDLLPKVSFGAMNAEVLILRMADRIEELESDLEKQKAVNKESREETLRDHTLFEVLSAATVQELVAEIRRRDNPPKPTNGEAKE